MNLEPQERNTSPAQPTSQDPSCKPVPSGLPWLEVLSSAAGGELVAGGYGSDAEEWDMVYLVDKEEADPMATAKDADDIQGWSDLWEQIKNDLCMANEKNTMLTLTQINQLIILQNFTTLCLKGIKCIAASERIMEQWHEGQGVHFARQIQALACHYQKFEQLPIDK